MIYHLILFNFYNVFMIKLIIIIYPFKMAIGCQGFSRYMTGHTDNLLECASRVTVLAVIILFMCYYCSTTLRDVSHFLALSVSRDTTQ